MKGVVDHSVIIAPLLSCLSLGGRSSLPTALLLLNDRHSCGDKLDTPVAAIGPSMQLAVVVEIVLTVELVLAAELA